LTFIGDDVFVVVVVCCVEVVVVVVFVLWKRLLGGEGFWVVGQTALTERTDEVMFAPNFKFQKLPPSNALLLEDTRLQS
jgi:hypothetical protein